MKKILLFLLILIFSFSCKTEKYIQTKLELLRERQFFLYHEKRIQKIFINDQMSHYARVKGFYSPWDPSKSYSIRSLEERDSLYFLILKNGKKINFESVKISDSIFPKADFLILPLKNLNDDRDIEGNEIKDIFIKREKWYPAIWSNKRKHEILFLDERGNQIFLRKNDVIIKEL